MTLAPVRRPTCEARPAAWKASPITYTPPWKYRTTWRGSIPSMVISAVGTSPSAAPVTVTPAGSGCADAYSRVSRRSSLTSLSNGKADCRRIASRFSRCSVLTEDLPSVGGGPGRPPGPGSPTSTRCWKSRRVAGCCQACRQAGERASPDPGDSPDRIGERHGTSPLVSSYGIRCFDSASVLDVQIALCSVMTRLVSDRRLIQVIRRPAFGTLAWSRCRAERPSGACGPGDAGLGDAPE